MVSEQIIQAIGTIVFIVVTAIIQSVRNRVNVFKTAKGLTTKIIKERKQSTTTFEKLEKRIDNLETENAYFKGSRKRYLKARLEITNDQDEVEEILKEIEIIDRLGG
jgi:formate-dependent nitrite reductase cytochrome c552 subunit